MTEARTDGWHQAVTDAGERALGASVAATGVGRHPVSRRLLAIAAELRASSDMTPDEALGVLHRTQAEWPELCATDQRAER